MKQTNTDLPVVEFHSLDDLWAWLTENHETLNGMWIRIYKKSSGVRSVSFEEVLDAGLCFGWSENMRRRGDDKSYLQRFTPRRKQGKVSKRNLDHVERLIREGKMMPAGLNALGVVSSG
jgi:uncharacterized protein YdeI (YjbR/CyaY-like superfamily)